MGSIAAFGDGWRIRWELPRDPVSGRRRQGSKVVRGSKRDAQRELALREAEVLTGAFTDPRRVTVEAFVAEWLPVVEGSVKPTTLEAYETKLRNACEFLGPQTLSKLTPAGLTRAYTAMLGRWSPQTIRHIHRVMHRMLQDAVRWRLLRVNPATLATTPRVPRRRKPTWTAEELHAFLENVKGDEWESLWRVAATTGMRRGELLGLRWPYLHEGALTVAGSLVATSGGPLLQEESKNASSHRRIALDSETSRLLGVRRRKVAEDRMLLGDAYEDHGLVWCWEDGKPIDPRLATKWFKRHAAAAGLPAIRLHGLRHTWATLALQSGVPAKVVSDRLGHSNIHVTLDTYTGHVPELDEDAAHTVAGLIDRA